MGIIKFIMGMLSPKKALSNRRPSLGIPVDPAPRETLRPHVHRAIEALGLINPAEEEWVLDLFHANQFGRSEGVSLVTRKSPDQMTTDEKRAIGLNPKAFMSHSYYSKLSDKGRENPLGALEHTLRMATFLESNRSRLEAAKRIGCTHVQANALFSENCGGCRKIKGKRFKIDDVPEIPINGCEEDVCSVRFDPIIKY